MYSFKLKALATFLICSILSLIIVSISKATSPTTYYVSTTGVDGNNISSDLNNPMGVAVVNSLIWVANRGNNKITVFNENGRENETTINQISGNGLNNPGEVANIGTKVWVPNKIASGTISVFNTDGTSGGSAISGNGLNSPWGATQIASNSANYAWVTNSGNNTISVFNTDGTTLTGTSTYIGNGLNTPVGVASVGSQIWVVNNGNNTISRFNPDGTSAGSVLSGNGLNNPVDLAVVGSTVWVTNNNSTISLFNTNGTSAGSALTGNGLSNVSGITTFTFGGNTFVWTANGALASNGANTISVFNSDGSNATRTCTSSLPCGSINYATTLAQPGDTVSVQAGTYNNTQTITAVGNSTSTITVSASGTVTITRPNPANDTSQTTSLLSINGSSTYVTVSGFTLVGMKGRSDFTSSDRPGNGELQSLSTKAGITITNNTIKGSNNTCIKDQNNNQTNLVISNNTIIDCGQANTQLDHGIYASGANITITGNTIIGSWGHGIQAYDGSTSDVANDTITNNTVTGATLAGILDWDDLTPSSSVSGNLVYSNGRGFDLKGAPFIGNNTIVDNTYNPAVQMFNTSGSWVGSIPSLKLAHYGEALVNSTVWVTNYNDNSISRFNTDGSSAGSDITGNGLSKPVGLAVVNSEVWVVNEGSQKISRFNTDGTTSNSQISGNGMTNNLPFKIAVVSTQVWVTNRNNSTISRFNTDGTSAGSVLSGNSLAFPEGIAVVGSTVWVGNENGGSSISLFNTNGTSAGTALTGNGLSHPYGITNFNSQVWVADNGADKILIFNTDGSAVSSTTSTGGDNAGDPADIISANSQAWISYASCSLCGKGIVLTNTTGGTFANNTLYGNITDIDNLTGSGITVKNNIFDENGQPGSPVLENSLPASSTYDYNLYYGVTSPADPDTHSISGTDPLFTNPSAATIATSNFTLQSSSTAISAGTPITGLVYWGAAPDLGSQCFYCSLSINSNPVATINGAAATITWGTNAKSNSSINYGLSSGSYTITSATSDTGFVFSHSNTLTGLSNCTTYHYQVKSIDAYGNSTTSGDSTFTTTGCSVPSGPPQCTSQAPSSAPDLYAANTNDSTSITLSFTSVSPVSSYFVEYGTSSGNYQYATGAFGNSSSQSINIASLNSGTKYYFKVRGGNGCATGPWSNELSAETFISQSINFPVEPAILDQLPQTTPQPQEQNFISPVPETNTNNEIKKVSLLIHVLDTDGKAVKNAKVTLHSTPITTYTDSSGVAKFDSVEAGQHTLAISYQNYQGTQPLYVNGDQNVSLTIQVKPANIIQNPVVEVLIAATCFLVILIIILLFRLKKKSVAQTK